MTLSAGDITNSNASIKSSKEKVEDAYKSFNDYLKARQLAKAKNNETNVDEM